MKRGRISTADSTGRSTLADAGSIPVVSTISLRQQAENIVIGLSPIAIRNMAYKHWKSEVWVRRYLCHCAYWRPGAVIAAREATP